ncbi:MAG TPA: glucokinase [Chlamydiales bacterium]
MILAGDIGGTHSRLALFDQTGELVIREEQKYRSREFKSLGEVVQTFLRQIKKSVQRACFGIAGPVREGRCYATNLPWIVDGVALSQELQIPHLHLLNDLEANAYGIKALKPKELYSLQQGKRQVGNQALISAGTGLGEAVLFWDGKNHRPFACEGGHADFAPRNREEIELLLWLQKEYNHVSYERVVSGPGLYALYRFLIETKREQNSPTVASLIQQSDPPSVISEQGRLKKDRACERAVEWFISLYGAEAGNLALKTLSLGGFYVGGGIAPHLIDELKKGAFIASFVDKGRFQELLSSIPISVVLNDNTALLGAALYARGLS